MLKRIVLAVLCISLYRAGLPTHPPTEDNRPTIILTDAQVDRLMRYHGVLCLRIERYRVYIKRNGRWIEVLRNPRERREVLR